MDGDELARLEKKISAARDHAPAPPEPPKTSTPRDHWMFAWLMIAFALVAIIGGAVDGSRLRVVLGSALLAYALLRIGRAVRNGARPWRRNAEGRFD